jgi:hypothetical protein
MIRRISIIALAVALVTVTIPKAASADDSTPPVPTESARVAAALARPHVLNLQNAGNGVVLTKEQSSAKQQSAPFLSTHKGKATLALASIAATVVIAYFVSQGPDPTPATAK